MNEYFAMRKRNMFRYFLLWVLLLSSSKFLVRTSETEKDNYDNTATWELKEAENNSTRLEKKIKNKRERKKRFNPYIIKIAVTTNENSSTLEQNIRTDLSNNENVGEEKEISRNTKEDKPNISTSRSEESTSKEIEYCINDITDEECDYKTVKKIQDPRKSPKKTEIEKKKKEDSDDDKMNETGSLECEIEKTEKSLKEELEECFEFFNGNEYIEKNQVVEDIIDDLIIDFSEYEEKQMVSKEDSTKDPTHYTPHLEEMKRINCLSQNKLEHDVSPIAITTATTITTTTSNIPTKHPSTSFTTISTAASTNSFTIPMTASTYINSIINKIKGKKFLNSKNYISMSDLGIYSVINYVEDYEKSFSREISDPFSTINHICRINNMNETDIKNICTNYSSIANLIRARKLTLVKWINCCQRSVLRKYYFYILIRSQLFYGNKNIAITAFDALHSVYSLQLFMLLFQTMSHKKFLREKTNFIKKLERKETILHCCRFGQSRFNTYVEKPDLIRFELYFIEANKEFQLTNFILQYILFIDVTKERAELGELFKEWDDITSEIENLRSFFLCIYKLVHISNDMHKGSFLHIFESELRYPFQRQLANLNNNIEELQKKVMIHFTKECGNDKNLFYLLYYKFFYLLLHRFLIKSDVTNIEVFMVNPFLNLIKVLEQIHMRENESSSNTTMHNIDMDFVKNSNVCLYLLMYYLRLQMYRVVLLDINENVLNLYNSIDIYSNSLHDSIDKMVYDRNRTHINRIYSLLFVTVNIGNILEKNKKYLQNIVDMYSVVKKINIKCEELEQTISIIHKNNELREEQYTHGESIFNEIKNFYNELVYLTEEQSIL